MNVTRCAIVLLLLLLVATTAFGQMTTGSVVGTVTSDGAPLPGATVTATSPNLQGARTTVSGNAGGFFLPNLAPGNYRLSFELSGMQRVVKNVTVNVSQTSRADVAMKVAAVAESLTVTAAAPVAAETSEIASNFTINQVNELPIGRTIDAVVTLAPGVTEAGPNNQITISGAGSYDNLFLVNGVIVNETMRGQPNPLYIEDAIQETTVLSGGISAEFGRFTGGVVSTITKSGGNEFSGSLRDSLGNPSWTEVSAYPGEVKPADELNQMFEGTLGGRILRDQLWFFTSGRYQSKKSTGQTSSTNLPYTTTNDDKRYEVKLTGQITPSHSLVWSYINSHNQIDKAVSGGRVVDYRSLAPYDRPRSLLAFSYNGILTSNFLVEGQFSRMNDKFTNGSNDRDLINGTILLDTEISRRMWSPTFCGTACPAKERDNKNWTAKGSYFLSTKATGNHSIIGGAEEFHQLHNESNFQSGSDFRIHGVMLCDDGTGHAMRCSDLPASTTWPTPLYFGTDTTNGQIEWDPIPALSQTADFAVRSLFVNDKWDLNTHFNFNLGLRYDKSFGTDRAGNKTVDDTAFSPRLGAAYDLKGNGKHRFSASYGRYVSKVDQGPADVTAAAGRYASYYWAYAGPEINPVGTPVNQLVPIEQVITRVFNWFNSVGGTNNSDYLNSKWLPGVSSRFDRSLQAPYMDELRGGYAVTFGNAGFVRADYMTRKWAKFYVVHRTLQTGKAVDPNGDQFDQGVVENASTGLSRTYDALQLQANYRPLMKLSIGGNYTYAKLRGNVEGETPSFATVLTDYGNYPEYTGFTQYNPTGYLGADMRHRLNIWASYDINTSAGRLNLSAYEHYHSALAYSASASIDVRAGKSTGPADGIVNPGYVTPPSSVNYFFSDRGAYRVDNITATDLGINFYLRPMAGAQFFVEADVLNLFNEQGIEDPDYIGQSVYTRRNASCKQADGSACVAFNPFNTKPVEGVNWVKDSNFGKPTSSSAYQLPRSYRVSFGVKF